MQDQTLLPKLRFDGAHLVDPGGQIVPLRGTNIGNWLLIEPWMFGIFNDDIRDQHTFLSILESRFGAERTHELMEAHRLGWFTQRDANHIASFGFNAVRLPVHYAHMLTEDGKLRDDAFRWIDVGIGYAEQAGLYTIIDLHGAPGGQSVDAPTGRLGQNYLWSDPDMQRRTILIWSSLAERYADRASVAAYDLINEPYGDFTTDVRPALIDLIGRLHDAVRAHDPDTLVLVPGTIRGITFYGDLAERGWTNAGYTEHFYPTIFGDASPSIGAHQRFVDSALRARADFIAQHPAPYLVGEMNPVFERVGGPAMKRAYFDLYDALGWSTTMWSYKLYTPAGGVNNDNWWMVANKHPFEFDIERGDYESLMAAVRGFATDELVVDDDLRQAMIAPTATTLLRPAAQSPVVRNPTLPDGWHVKTIGEGPTATASLEGDHVRLRAGGRDIWASSDSFGFLARSLTEGPSLFMTMETFDAQDRFAKAGIMLRSSDDLGAAHALMHVFRDGRVLLAWRESDGGVTQERTLAATGFPATLGIETSGNEITAHYRDVNGMRRRVIVPIDAEQVTGDAAMLGIVVCAHEPEVTAAVSGSVSSSWPGEHEASRPRSTAGDAIALSADWSSWGVGWHFTDGLGSAVATRVAAATGEAGMWQDISLPPQANSAKARTLSIDATLGSHPSHGSVELRVELPVEVLGETRWLTLDSQPYDLADLGDGPPARLTLTAIVPPHLKADTLRVLLVHTPGEGRDGVEVSVRTLIATASAGS